MNHSPTDTDGARPMRVTIICHSDSLGGASIVTFRLMQALRRAGVEARMLVYCKLSDNQNVALISNRNGRGANFLLERLKIFMCNGFSRDNLFKVSIANTGFNLTDHPWVKEADIILLSWINQGLLSLDNIRQIGRLGKPIVWVMHDMWNLTGICHHAYECEGYKNQCGNCMFLSGHKANDLSRRTLMQKKKLYDTLPIHFVAVSNWLAERCKESFLLGDRKGSVIPNPFPIDNFITVPRRRIESFHIDYNRDLIVMGAARLDDPIKGLDYAIDALNYLFDNHPKVATNTMVVFFGDMKDPSVFDRLRFTNVWLGRINDPKLLINLYASSKVVLSTSLYETLPGTLIEGQASGCLPVTFGKGGQHDIVKHKVNGYIASYKDSRDVAEGIIWALGQNPDRDALHESVRQRFASSAIARQYIELFNSLLNKK